MSCDANPQQLVDAAVGVRKLDSEYVDSVAECHKLFAAPREVPGLPRRPAGTREYRLPCGAVHKAKGFHPKVVVLNVKELERAASNNPFPKAESQPKTLHLFFLSEEPLCADLASLKRLRSGKEAFALRGKIFYLHTPDGFAVS